VLAVALTLGLSAGVVDVCIGLLNKPRGFETLPALPPPILAVAAVALPIYVVLWLAMRPLAARAGLDQSAAMWSLAAFLGTAFAIALIAGFHIEHASPQLLFKAVGATALAVLTAAGVYNLAVVVGRDATRREWCSLLMLALPLLLFDVLAYEWIEVYAIDHVVSMETVLSTIVIGLVAAATIAIVYQARQHWSAVRVLATFAVVLALGSALGAFASRRTTSVHTTVQASTNQSGHTPARIVLITVDTLRADALSVYRADAPRTRAIDDLAKDGMVFEHAVAPAPWTLPSLVSILTGLMPAAHRAIGFTSAVAPTITTLAEYLNERGYRTGAVVHNDLLNPQNGLADGFADYLSLHEQWFGESLGMKTLQALAPSRFPPRSWPSNDDQTNVAVEWLESNRDRDFFLWVHYLDPHAPYAPPREYRVADPLPAIGAAFDAPKVATQGFFVPSLAERQAIRALYDGEVRYIDAAVGRVLGTLKRLRLYDDALVVFTSDHGEEFWEHGRSGHGHSLYDELLRVPLIVKLPGAAARGRSAAMVSTASVTPTILDASRIHYDEGNLSAASLWPLLDRSAGSYKPAPLVSNAQILFDRKEAVLFDGYKYIVSDVDRKEELFDLTADPAEQHSIAATGGERLTAARQLLQDQAARDTAIRRRLRIDDRVLPADDDTLRRLRTLGYLK
jgi:arylsulfatase A-like enzyme